MFCSFGRFPFTVATHRPRPLHQVNSTSQSANRPTPLQPINYSTKRRKDNNKMSLDQVSTLQQPSLHIFRFSFFLLFFVFFFSYRGACQKSGHLVAIYPPCRIFMERSFPLTILLQQRREKSPDHQPNNQTTTHPPTCLSLLPSSSLSRLDINSFQ